MREHQPETQTRTARVGIHVALLAWATIVLIALSLPGRHPPRPTQDPGLVVHAQR
jgi:hypothetical protein